LARNKAAEYITSIWGVPCSPKTLAKLASVGGGPEFRKGQRAALYEPAALDAWVQSRISSPLRRASEAAQQAA
jgi:hypothetical protein